jgi:hypothetical protein
MASNITPCSEPDRDPNDWFLNRHGQQYGDEPWLDPGDKEKLLAAMAEKGMDRLKQISAIARIEAQMKRDALGRRRRAREACYECPIRLACLEGALDRREAHGIYGGMYEEEREKFLRQRTRQKRRNNGAQEERSGANPQPEAGVPPRDRSAA